MHPLRRTLPLFVWLAPLLGVLLLLLLGMGLHIAREGQGVSLPDFAYLLNGSLFSNVIAGLKTPLFAAALCLPAGFMAGSLLALGHKRTTLVCWLGVLSWLVSACLLYLPALLPLLPAGPQAFLQPVSAWRMPAAAAMAPGLLPVMAACVGAFSLSSDPALAEAARDLGASRPSAYLTCIFPRALTGAAAGCLATFLCALGLASVTDPGISQAQAAAAALFFFGIFLILWAALRLVHQKTRRLALC